jgi:hypothetical protein
MNLIQMYTKVEILEFMDISKNRFEFRVNFQCIMPRWDTVIMEKK